MEDWLEKAARYGDVPPLGGASLLYVHAGLMDNLKKKIVSALLAGMGVTAIIANFGLQGEGWKDYIESLRSEVVDNEYVESLIADDEGLTPSVMDIPESETNDAPNVTPDNDDEDVLRNVKYNDIASLISEYEGNKGYVYDDATSKSIPWSKSKKGDPTIGIGHLMTGSSADRAIFEKLFGGDVDYDSLMNNTQTLDEDQILRLFQYDVGTRISEIIRKIPNFTNFNGETQAAIMNAKYRGDLGPRTIDRINEGNWMAAADEYLDHDGYKRTKYRIENNLPTDRAGIVPRMEHNAEVFRRNTR